MQVYYDPEKEYQPYILQSALWSYLQHTDKILNVTRDEEQVKKLMALQTLIKNKISPAFWDPMAGPGLAIVCDNIDEKNALLEVLTFYLDETKEIIKTIRDPGITGKCLQDIAVIKDEIMSAIRVADSVPCS